MLPTIGQKSESGKGESAKHLVPKVLQSVRFTCKMNERIEYNFKVKKLKP